jgi:hypothetical protein
MIPPRELEGADGKGTGSKISGLVQKWLKPTGTTVGLGAMLAGLYMRRANQKANLHKIRSLKKKLVVQNMEFQNSQSQREELLRNIDLQLQQMTFRLESLRRSVGDKIDQFDGFVKARLGGLSYESYKHTFDQAPF